MLCGVHSTPIISLLHPEPYMGWDGWALIFPAKLALAEGSVGPLM
jgi:hypothetical protein